MRRIIITLLLCLHSSTSFAEQHLMFGIVPQQSAGRLAQLWIPIMQELSKHTGFTIHFATAPDIPTFEERLANGVYDIAYMNPYHYTVFHQQTGYQALAKARNKHIKGIIVVHKDSPITTLAELDGRTLAFPAPAAFAATILTTADLLAQNVDFDAEYVSSHDSVYRTVAKGIYPAGGGIVRTFNNVESDIRQQLKILWTTPGYPPHAIAAHPRIDSSAVTSVQQALANLSKQTTGKALLQTINIRAFEPAVDSDWNDIRALQLSQIAQR